LDIQNKKFLSDVRDASWRRKEREERFWLTQRLPETKVPSAKAAGTKKGAVETR
jgi:hypothetical protein